MTTAMKRMLVILALALGMVVVGQTEQPAVSAQSPDGHSLDAADGDPADTVFVNNDGNVGIGTTEPRTQLHVLGRISTGADFVSPGSLTFFPPDGFAWFHIDNGPAGDRPTGRLRISAGVNPGDDEFVSILQDGNVGIGTTNPQHKLSVKGTVQATELVVVALRTFQILCLRMSTHS